MGYYFLDTTIRPDQTYYKWLNLEFTKYTKIKNTALLYQVFLFDTALILTNT